MGTTRRVVCASPAYFAERGTATSPVELAAHACIAFEQTVSRRTWHFMPDESEFSVPIRSRLVAGAA